MSFFKNRIEQVQLGLLSLVWIILFTIPVLFGDFDNVINWDHIFKIWQEYIVLFFIFIMNRFFLMPKFFFKGKRVLYFSSLIVIIILSVSVIYFSERPGGFNGVRNVEMRLPPPGIVNIDGKNTPPMSRPGMKPRMRPGMDSTLNKRVNPRITQGANGFPNRRMHDRVPMDLIPPFVNVFIMSILLVGFDMGLLFFSKWMESEQTKLKAEKESIKDKMAFLKNQISPHFFMNTLNNIHALVDIDTEEAKESIIKLSHMMDYMLYESQTTTISMNKEMNFIESYVDLMKLRVTDDVNIILDFPKEIPNINIPPLLTISFIENAFKYGVSYEADSFIKIHFDVSETHLNFIVENSVHKKAEKKKNSGIGIANSKNRLELIYDDKYSLDIEDSLGDYFSVKMSVPLIKLNIPS